MIGIRLDQVSFASNRGNILHQTFSISYLDSGDIRYKVPVVGVPVSWGDVRYTYKPYRDTYHARGDAPFLASPSSAYPLESDRKDKPNAYEVRGRTGTWENHHS